jgi:hypothetical protein
MPSNVIDLTPASIRSSLNAFREHRRLEDFLSTLTALAPSTIDVPDVWQAWKRLNGQITADKPVNQVLDWLSGLAFPSAYPDEAETDEDLAFTAEDEEDGISNFEQKSREDGLARVAFEAGFQFATKVLEHTEYRELKMKDPANPYGFFFAAYPLDKVLPNYLIVDEAARLIARYLNTIYQRGGATQTVKPEYIPVNNPRLREFVEQELLPWAFNHELGTLVGDESEEANWRRHQLETLRAFRNHFVSFLDGLWISRELKLGDRDDPPLRVLAEAMVYLPQAYFERITSNLSVEEGLGELPGLHEFYQIMLSLPLGETYSSWEEFEQEVSYDNPLRVYTEHFQDLSEFPVVPLAVLPRLIDVESHENLFGTAVNDLEGHTIDWPLISDILPKRITRLRRKKYEGKSPFDLETAANLGFWLYLSCTRFGAHDLSYILPCTVEGRGFGINPFASDEFSPKDRSELYLLVYRLALEEGWHAFARAVLIFYLFSQPIFSKGPLHVDWSDLGQVMQSASTLPGAEQVAHAASLAMEILENNGQKDSLDYLNLQAWAVHETVEAVPADLPLVRYEEIEKDLIESIGREAWMKLSPKGKRQLLDAEADWSAKHRDVGKGRGDFGVVAVSYVKVFEGELLNRLDPVFQSSAFIEYFKTTYHRSPERHMSIGPALHLLKDFTKLPKALQEHINDIGIRVQDDQALIKRLLDAMKVRNKGAHAGEFNEKEVVDLRKLLFEKGGLRRFIELL